MGYSAALVALGPGPGVQACPAGGPTSLAVCLLDSALANNIAKGGKSGYTVDAVGAVVGAATTNVVYGVDSASGLQPDQVSPVLLGRRRRTAL